MQENGFVSRNTGSFGRIEASNAEFPKSFVLELCGDIAALSADYDYLLGILFFYGYTVPRSMAWIVWGV